MGALHSQLVMLAGHDQRAGACPPVRACAPGRVCVRVRDPDGHPTHEPRLDLSLRPSIPIASYTGMSDIDRQVTRNGGYMNEWLTVTEAAAFCGVSGKTVYRWLETPGLGFPSPDGTGGRKRWRRSDVVEWLRVNRPWVLQKGE